jgi:DNA polymerase III subunit gamma/tau
MAYQTLYRRYRSQRFSDLRGQEHIVRSLRSAVRDERVGHAYLFSGPRGTGKTSTARILAKALNCDHLDDGDPCGECESCRAIETGSSFDLHELDAASNNGIEAIRDLISRTGIGSPGRTKVYILDEVHMLSAGASNALLKTLEDPPSHVVFVLATTDPHKVLPTIRSRTQHLEFGLLPADVLSDHVRWVIADAGLDVDEEGIAYALARGGGSARDTLSALEQVVSAGGVPSGGGSADQIIEALCERDTGGAMVAVAQAMSVGREPRPLAEGLLASLRDVFLASVGGPLDHLTDGARQQAADRAHRLGRASITRALDLLGEAIAEMRHVGDTRIPLEVALVRLTHPEVDTSLEALVDRVSRLERQLESGVAPPARGAASAAAPVDEARSAEPPPMPPMPRRDRDATKPAPESTSVPHAAPEPEPEPAPAPASPAPASVTPAPVADGGVPSLDAITSAWPQVSDRLSKKARARYGGGKWVEVGETAVFALPNPIHRDRCEDVRPEVESALAEHFGRPVPVSVVVDGAPAPPAGDDPLPSRPASSAAPASRASTPPPASRPSAEAESSPFDEADEIGDVADLDDADVPAMSSVDRIAEMFPGAEVVEE